MKPIFIVGNWKSNKNLKEAQEWLNEAKNLLSHTPIEENKTVVLCVPFTLLDTVSRGVTEGSFSFDVGAQDVSAFNNGAYTGEVNATQVKEFATYVLIGHSERRRYFHETDADLAEKVKQSLLQNLIPVYLVQSDTDPIPQGVKLVGYEPVGAIGTGHAESPESANEIAQKIKEKNPFVEHVLYGGSVTPENVSSFTSLSDINGVIPGGASLTPQGFFALVHNA